MDCDIRYTLLKCVELYLNERLIYYPNSYVIPCKHMFSQILFLW